MKPVRICPIPFKGRVTAFTTYRTTPADQESEKLSEEPCEEKQAPVFRTLRNWLGCVDPFVTIEQVHGNHVLRAVRGQSVSKTIGAELDAEAAVCIGQADAIVTVEKMLPLAIRTADCVPIFYYDPVQHVAGLAHAGWRGTLSSIAARVVDEMVGGLGSKRESLYVWFGPSIGPCCYEVDRPVIDAFYRQFPHSAARFFSVSKRDHAQLDLWAANRHVLLEAGVRDEHIHCLSLCTSCRVDRFYSYRRERGRTGRMLSVIMPH